ncbi:hypothetical protein FrEUN1fDRAFT_0428 [Parafrankia sp. EUN1f]|nr:hypothetical protein FrEUN1fDRAFT_0428 [Parafrankia sp. EUN1f]
MVCASPALLLDRVINGRFRSRRIAVECSILFAAETLWSLRKDLYPRSHAHLVERVASVRDHGEPARLQRHQPAADD